MNRSLHIGILIALLTVILAVSSMLFPQSPQVRFAIDSPTSAYHSALSTGTKQTETAEQMPSPPAKLVEDLKSILSTKTGVPSYDILFISAEAVEWSDACLGATKPEEICAQVITPGYRIILSTLTEEYEFHTDRTGQELRLAE